MSQCRQCRIRGGASSTSRQQHCSSRIKAQELRSQRPPPQQRFPCSTGRQHSRKGFASQSRGRQPGQRHRPDNLAAGEVGSACIVAAGAVRGTFGGFARGLSNMLDQDKDICADLPAAGSGGAAAAGSSTRQLTRRLLPASAASSRRQHLKIIRCAAVGLCNSCMHNITVRAMGRWGDTAVSQHFTVSQTCNRVLPLPMAASAGGEDAWCSFCLAAVWLDA